MIMEIEIDLKKIEFLFIIGFLLFVFYSYLNVTLNSPIVFGDEGFHSYLAEQIAEKLEYPVWIDFEGTNLIKNGYSRPPLFNILEASLYFIFKSDLVFKVLTPFTSILIGLAVFVLTKKIYNSSLVSTISTILILTIPSFVTYTTVFYTDILFLFYTTLFFFSFILWKKDNSQKYLVLSFVFGGLSLLTKRPGFFIIPFLFIEIFIDFLKRKNIIKTLKIYSIPFTILFLIIAGFLLRNSYYYKNPICSSINLPVIRDILSTKGCSIKYYQEKLKFSGRTEKIGTESNVFSLGLVNYLDFAYGNLWLLFFGVVGGLIYLKDDKFFVEYILMLLFFLLIFFGTTSRAEDTARYTLGFLQTLVVISSLFFSKVIENIKKFADFFVFAAIIFILILSWFNMKSKLEVMSSVKQFSKLFFDACEWVRNHPDEVPENSRLMTVWAHRTVYNCKRNANRQIADIVLSRNITEVVDLLKKHGYTHIFIQKFSIDLQNKHLVERYDLDFVNFLEDHPETFVKIYENGPSLQECQQYWINGYSCDGNTIYRVNSTTI